MKALRPWGAVLLRSMTVVLVLAAIEIPLAGPAGADSGRVQNPDNKHWYQRFDTSLSWPDAQAFCAARHGYLATVTSPVEQAFVFGSLGTGWLGGSDAAQEGHWSWVTGEPWGYAHWASGEPNNGGTAWPWEHYLHVESTGEWNDVGPVQSDPICEWGEDLSVLSATPLPPPRPTKNDGTYFSIPRPGQQNHWRRQYRVTYRVMNEGVDVTSQFTVSNMRVELDAGSGAVLQDGVVDAGLGAQVRAHGANAVDVQVSFNGTASQVASQPPPTDLVAYRFTLTAQGTAGELVTSEPYTAAPVHALWRMPDGFARYSPCGQAAHDREGPGGDDWVSKSTYEWMAAHPSLISAVNDASLEHGINGGHRTHAKGTDIDMFHVYALAGASQCSGTEYYRTLTTTVQRALTGDTAARQEVAGWVSATRARFDSLLALPEVRQVIYARGAAVTGGRRSPGLPDGWAQSLIQQGRCRGATRGVDLQVADPWVNASNGKLAFKVDHDNHIHLTLG